MIEESARVVSVEGDRVIVEAEARTSCQSCAVEKGCGTSVLSNVVGNKVMRFELENTHRLRAGDRVVLGLPEDSVVKGSALVYLSPLIAMILGALGADMILPLDEPGRDITITFSALSMLVLSILLTRRWFDTETQREAYTPVILRVELETRQVAS